MDVKRGQRWKLCSGYGSKRYALWELLEDGTPPYKAVRARLLESTWDDPEDEDEDTTQPGEESHVNLHGTPIKDDKLDPYGPHWELVKAPTNPCATCDGEAPLDDYLCQECRNG